MIYFCTQHKIIGPESCSRWRDLNPLFQHNVNNMEISLLPCLF